MKENEVDQELINVMTQNLESYKQLLELLKAENQVLIKNPRDLPEITVKKETLLKKLEEQEKLRQFALVNVAAEYNLKLKDASLEMLARVSKSQRYFELYRAFTGIAKEIKFYYEKNNALLQQGLSTVNDILSFIFAEIEGPVYGPGGDISENKTPNKYVDGHI